MDKNTVIKIANLAKIDISENKVDEIRLSLEKILNLVDEMNSINTDKMHPMAHPLNLKQELRKDEVTVTDERDLFQKNNKFTKDGYYKVPKIID